MNGAIVKLPANHLGLSFIGPDPFAGRAVSSKVYLGKSGKI
jgi:hypothetical protein